MKKIVLYCGIVFLLATALITMWYVIDMGHTLTETSFESIKNVAFRFGFYGATMVTLLFLFGYLAFTKIKNKVLLGFSVIVLLGLCYLAFGWFLWYIGINGLVENPIIE